MAAFVPSADRIPKEFGILLAVAILTDALIVRMTLVPALFNAAAREDVVHPRLARPRAAELTIESPHEREAAELPREDRAKVVA